MYYGVAYKFNIDRLSQIEKDILLGEALAKLDIIRGIIKRKAKDKYSSVYITTLQDILQYWPENEEAEDEIPDVDIGEFLKEDPEETKEAAK